MKNDTEMKAFFYNGKKTYGINPTISRKSAIDEKIPDYRNEEFAVQSSHSSNKKNRRES